MNHLMPALTALLGLLQVATNPPASVKDQWPPDVPPTRTVLLVHEVTEPITVVRGDKTYTVTPFKAPLEGGSDPRVRLALTGDDQLLIPETGRVTVTRITAEGELGPAEVLGLGQTRVNLGPVQPLTAGTVRAIRWLTIPVPSAKAAPNLDQPMLILPLAGDEVDPTSIPFRFWPGRAPVEGTVSVRLEFDRTADSLVVKDWGRVTDRTRILQFDLDPVRQRLEQEAGPLGEERLMLYLVVTDGKRVDRRPLVFPGPVDSAPGSEDEKFQRLASLLLDNRTQDTVKSADRATEMARLIDLLCGDQRSRVLLLLAEHVNRPTGRADRPVLDQLRALCLQWDVSFDVLTNLTPARPASMPSAPR